MRRYSSHHSFHTSDIQRRRHTVSKLCHVRPEGVGKCIGRGTMKHLLESRVARVLYSFLERTQHRPEEYAKILKSLTRTKQVSYHCLNKYRLHIPYSHVESTPQDTKACDCCTPYTHCQEKGREIPSISPRVYHKQMLNILDKKIYQ